MIGYYYYSWIWSWAIYYLVSCKFEENQERRLATINSSNEGRYSGFQCPKCKCKLCTDLHIWRDYNIWEARWIIFHLKYTRLSTAMIIAMIRGIIVISAQKMYPACSINQYEWGELECIVIWVCDYFIPHDYYEYNEQSGYLKASVFSRYYVQLLQPFSTFFPKKLFLFIIFRHHTNPFTMGCMLYYCAII